MAVHVYNVQYSCELFTAKKVLPMPPPPTQPDDPTTQLMSPAIMIEPMPDADMSFSVFVPCPLLLTLLLLLRRFATAFLTKPFFLPTLLVVAPCPLNLCANLNSV